MRFLSYLFMAMLSIGLIGAIGAVGAGIYIISYYGRGLPDYNQLKDYEPPVVTRLYALDGRLMSEYAQEKRVFVPVKFIPARIRNAFISAEDQNFYQHHGVDYIAIARASLSNVKNAASGRRPVGASTITQQVAKNFLLTNEVSIERKVKEAILAYRMERALPKDRLLELYLNEIYLGGGAYGVAAASLNYFNKSLEELSIAEAAYLAALPKAPNNYHPVRRHDAAVARRNWVIDRMAEDGYITAVQAEAAKAEPLTVIKPDDADAVEAPYFAEQVRRELEARYGEKSLYGGGLSVHTTMDPFLQRIAVDALRKGLMAYDHRRGWRGPVTHLDTLDDWAGQLEKSPAPEGKLVKWSMAVVLDSGDTQASLGFADKSKGKITLDGIKWTGKDSVKTVLKSGDVVLVEKTDKGYVLQQIPAVQGAIVALDPHTGRVLAMQGGWKFEKSVFNRATQAWRQPGSAFKPFIYLAALDSGFTPSTLVMDAPYAFSQGKGMPLWRPTNYKDQFFGPTPLRVGIEKSRNLMTVRLAEKIGMEKVADYAKKFGIVDAMDLHLAASLGSAETTVLRLTNAYAQILNGGRKLTPSFVDRIQDRYGQIIFKHDTRPCPGCGDLVNWENQAVPDVPDTREQIADPRTTYQMVSILEGVVQRGTATSVKPLNRPLAGKTGTTNESRDAWFVGFSPDLVVGVYVGHDTPKTLGKRETGGSIAVPIFKDFMEQALKDKPAIPFRIPPGIRQVQVNADTGRRATPGDKHVIWEAFVTGTEPGAEGYQPPVIDGSAESSPAYNPMPESAPVPGSDAITGTGGFY